MSDYTIIENICPKDDSVKFYNPKRVHFPIPHAEIDKKRFSFVFKPVFNTTLLFLQCELTLCTKKERDAQKLPKVSGPSPTWAVTLTFWGETAWLTRDVWPRVITGGGFPFGSCPMEVITSMWGRNCAFSGILENKSPTVWFLFPCMLSNSILRMINQDLFSTEGEVWLYLCHSDSVRCQECREPKGQVQSED